MLTCPFHWLTGLDCPFCGAQRMVLALVQGHVAEAFWYNPALFVALPLVGAWWLWKKEVSSRAAFVLLCLAILWGIVRNLMPVVIDK